MVRFLYRHIIISFENCPCLRSTYGRVQFWQLDDGERVQLVSSPTASSKLLSTRYIDERVDGNQCHPRNPSKKMLHLFLARLGFELIRNRELVPSNDVREYANTFCGGKSFA